MAHLMQAPIILLKEGTDTSQGTGQIISNINACQAVVDIVKTTLGPRGMDKLIQTESGVTVTNDGATVMNLLTVVHPAADMLVDIAKSQDAEVGDGTTSVVILAGELLEEAKGFIEGGVSPLLIISGFKRALELVLKELENCEVDLMKKTKEEKRELLLRCAETSLTSKLIASKKSFFADIILDAVSTLDVDLDKDMIGIKKVTGGSAADSFFVKGVVFKKTFSYAGFEQQPKKFKDAKIMLLNMELELKAEKENAEIRVDSPDEYQSIVDAEWTLIYEKLDQIVKCGANVVLSKLPIGDLATQYFADHGVFCAGRVDDADMKRTSRATGASVQTTVNEVGKEVLGHCGEFEELQIGSERYNVFKDCAKAKSATLVLRGGAQQFLDEAERSLHDAIMTVRRAIKTNTLVSGGGSIEMHLSKRLREISLSELAPSDVKIRPILMAFARAMEVIPKNLAQNSGFDSTDLISQLRMHHSKPGNRNMTIGVDCINGGTCCCLSKGIWEPSLVKRNALNSATEAACTILSIDETIKNPSSSEGPSRVDQKLMDHQKGRGLRRPRRA